MKDTNSNNLIMKSIVKNIFLLQWKSSIDLKLKDVL